jgi:hypothetical protein
MIAFVDTSTSRAASDQRADSVNSRITTRRCSPEGDFTPVVIDAASPLPPPVVEPTIDVGTIEISVGAATVRIRGVADAKTLAVVLKALRSLE